MNRILNTIVKICFWIIPIIILLLVQITPGVGHRFNLWKGMRIHGWADEDRFVMAWDRELKESEVDSLIDSLGGHTNPGSIMKTEHLIHHGDEQYVIDSLNNAVNSEYLGVVSHAEFCFYRIGINPEDSFNRVIDLFVNGGLDEDDQYILGNQTGGQFTYYEHQRDAKALAVSIRISVSWLLFTMLKPSEDIEQLPKLLALLDSDDLNLKIQTIHILGNFKALPEIRDTFEELLQNDPEAEIVWAINYANSDRFFNNISIDRYIRIGQVYILLLYILPVIWLVCFLVIITRTISKQK